MNTENHEIPEIPENSLCLLRFAAQTPCTKGNRAAMAALNAYALTLPWEGATPLVCIKQEVVYLTSAYVAQAPEPDTKWDDSSNEERCALIEKEFNGHLTPAEESRLEALQLQQALWLKRQSTKDFSHVDKALSGLDAIGENEEPVEWHNPDNLTPEQVGEGYRLLAAGELIPPDGECCVFAGIAVDRRTIWTKSVRAGFLPHRSTTYRTTLPYHPSR